jgi:4-amino-4-deoxychorismate lyase
MSSNLLETIKIVDGEILHLSYHQKRLENSLRSLGIRPDISLYKHLDPPQLGLFRCRVVYNKDICSIEYIPYTFASIDSLKLIECEDFDYSLKFEERQKLNTLFELREHCDDILISTNTLLRDTSKANVAFYDGSHWYTPSRPLLFGTTRARYLDEKKLIEKALHVNDLAHFEKCAVLNAMVDFCVLKDGIIA